MSERIWTCRWLIWDFERQWLVLVTVALPYPKPAVTLTPGCPYHYCLN